MRIILDPTEERIFKFNIEEGLSEEGVLELLLKESDLIIENEEGEVLAEVSSGDEYGEFGDMSDEPGENIDVSEDDYNEENNEEDTK